MTHSEKIVISNFADIPKKYFIIRLGELISTFQVHLPCIYSQGSRLNAEIWLFQRLNKLNFRSLSLGNGLYLTWKI